MGVSINEGTPKWMVYNGKPCYKMDDLVYPILGNLHIAIMGHYFKANVRYSCKKRLIASKSTLSAKNSEVIHVLRLCLLFMLH